MADDRSLVSAIHKRHEQLKRWEESDTNKCINNSLVKDKRVKFQDGCIFLAACSSGDHEEVKRLLDRGANINTANIDGLTALHQACIDQNLDMVEFLVQNGADVDVCDNEGWTPLHATASCGFTEIARYLLIQKCNVAAVNNDGDLPYDICEDDTMEKLLHETMEEQGVDADAARREEEDRMMEDANKWLSALNQGEILEEDKHSKTGATAMHVAAAKGYVKVISVILQAGADINAKDVDGWTPLHAAAHWGQEESCKILAENMCDMEAKNLVGQTAFDVADTESVKLLEELKQKQASLKDQQKDPQIIHTKVGSNRRRSSVTRMSIEQKHNVMKNVDQEKATLEPKIPPTQEEEKVQSSSSTCSEDEQTSDSETEKKNEINKKTSEENQPRERDKPPLMTTVEIKEKQAADKSSEETIESTDIETNNKKLSDENDVLSIDLKKEPEVIGDGLHNDKIYNNDKTEIQKEEKERDTSKTEKIEDAQKNKENIIKKVDKKEKGDAKDTKDDDVFVEEKKALKKESNKDKEKDVINEKAKKDTKDPPTPLIENSVPNSDKTTLKRTISAPPAVTEVPKISINSKSTTKDERETPSWRVGLRKTGSTSAVPHDTTVNKINEEDKNLSRSASSPRLAEEDENKKNEKNDKSVSRRPYLSTSFSGADHNNSSLTDRYGGTSSQILSNPYRYTSGSGTGTGSSYQPAYVPFYRRQAMESERKEQERAGEKPKETIINIRNSAPPTTLPVTTASVTSGVTISTSPSSTYITSPSSAYTNYNRKSFEPPKRDEKTEMQRKVRAKRARENRRSTQGVTLEEVQQANEVLRKSDPVDPSSTSSSTTLSQPSALERTARSSATERKSQDTTDSVSRDKDNTHTSNTLSDRDPSSRLSSDLRRTCSSHDSSDSSSISSWRRSRDVDASKKDDDTSARSSSFRRSRVGDTSTPSSYYSSDSTYVPRNRTDRSERNALSVADIGGNTSLNTNLTRSASLRTERLRKAEDDGATTTTELSRRDRESREADKLVAEADKDDKDEKRPESAAIRRRRINRERRSTGITSYTPENKDEEDEKENKDDAKDSDKPDTEDKSTGSRYNRYGSASDVPTQLSSRPSSYSEYSRSSSSLEKDYKKLYEEEKIEKDRVKRELEQVKKELREAKLEIDRQMKKNEASRMSDTNDKRERRALERKLSELEEEIKKMDTLKEDNRRLREENGALIRVISKLSK